MFDVSRWTIINWIKSGRIGYREKPTRHRTCNPADVAALLAEAERDRRDKPPA